MKTVQNIIDLFDGLATLFALTGKVNAAPFKRFAAARLAHAGVSEFGPFAADSAP
jgi:hypothetical protein